MPNVEQLARTYPQNTIHLAWISYWKKICRVHEVFVEHHVQGMKTENSMVTRNDVTIEESYETGIYTPNIVDIAFRYARESILDRAINKRNI
jgi:hypothetical protein